MRSITDVFIRHPVLAIVVNLVIVLIGWRAITALPVQQYPQLESSSIIVTTLYYGAGAETIRGFITTPIERAVSAIAGVDYVESTSRAGQSTVNVRLKLNHDSTAALGGGDGEAATGALRAARRSRAACHRRAAHRPAVRHLLSQLQLEGAERPGHHGLPHPQRAAAPRHDRGGAEDHQQRRRPADCDARLDRS